MVLNHQFPQVQKIRANASIIVVPIQYLVDWPIELFHWASTSFTTQQELLEENAKLRARQLLLEAKLQKLLALERENAQLKELLSSSTHLDGKVLVGQILAVSSDPYTQEVTVDKGQKEGIYGGQPVLDAYGVMGQVITPQLLTSQVLLITDTRSAIPVQDNRSGARTIAAGMGYSNRLTLLHVPDTADIAVGDVLVTSGLGERFPYGYPVGVVTSINKNTGDGFAQVIAIPSAHIDQSTQILLIWPQPEESTNTVQSDNNTAK